MTKIAAVRANLAKAGRADRVYLDQTYFYGFKSSVRNFGAKASAFFMNSTFFSGDISGAGVVRLWTGSPIARKNSSAPAGEHMQSIRA